MPTRKQAVKRRRKGPRLGDPASTMPAERHYKQPWENKTFGADFSKEGPVLDGESLSIPAVAWEDSPPPAGAPDIGPASLNAQQFRDPDGGRTIPANKGVIARFSGGTAGEYRAKFTAHCSGGDDLSIPAIVVVR